MFQPLARNAADRNAAAINLFGEGLQAGDSLRLQSAKAQLLDAIGEPAFQDTSIVGRWWLIEQFRPMLLEGRGGHAFQRGDLRQNGVGHRVLPPELRFA